MGPGGQYTFQNGGLQLYPATSWILTVLFICKLGSSAFTFLATQFGIFQEPPQILVHGLFGLDLAYCLSYHQCLKLSRMLGVPLKNIVNTVELLLNMVCFIYIYNNYTFKPLTLFGTGEAIFIALSLSDQIFSADFLKTFLEVKIDINQVTYFDTLPSSSSLSLIKFAPRWL